jgi:hypothetical protein
MNAEGIARRMKLNQCSSGEVSPGVDAKTIEEALEVAREMARALTVSDVQEGESLHDFERRVFNAWVNYEGFRGGYNSSDGCRAPFLNRSTGELSPGSEKPYWEERCGSFDQSWEALPGAKKKLDLALPKPKKIKKTEGFKPEPKAIPVAPPPPPIRSKPAVINFAWISPDAQRYSHGGRI